MELIKSMSTVASQWFSLVAEAGNKVLFWNVFPFFGIEFPFLIFWLCLASVYFMIKAKLYNGKAIALSVKYFLSRRIEERQKEEIRLQNCPNTTSKAASLFAVGSNVDLGTVFGTALAVQTAGLGVLLWMIIGAILSIPIRFIEVFVSHRYRSVNSVDGAANGGPQQYIEKAFAGERTQWIGKAIRLIFILCITTSTFFSPQINQTVQVISHFIDPRRKYSSIMALIIAIVVISMLAGSFNKITGYLRKLAPPVGYIYIGACLLIVAYNANNIIPTIKGIVVDGLSLHKGIASLSFLFALGARRSFFCLETGMGSSGITHASSVNSSSFAEATFGAIVPIIAVCLVALCSGFVVGVTNGHIGGGNQSGINIMIAAFQSVHGHMQYVLLLVIPLFGLSTAIAWAYYGKSAWTSLFGEKSSKVYFLLLFIAYWGCGQSDNFKSILDAADVINLSTTIPNIIALYVISKKHFGEISELMSKPIKELDERTTEMFFQEEERV